MLQMILPPAPEASAPYSQGALATGPQRTLYVSGQVGVDAAGRIGADIAEQAQIAVANLYAVLAQAGMDASNIAKVTIYLPTRR